MTVRATATCALNVIETVAAASAPASPADGVSNSRQFSAYNQLNQILDGTTTPLVDTVVDLSFALSGSATKTWDLTAAPQAKDVNDTVDLTGKKLIALIISAPTDNAAAGMNMAPGAANGYDVLGGSSDSITIYPGMTMCFFQLGAAAGFDAVGATDKTIDFAGTDGDEIDCLALFGTQP